MLNAYVLGRAFSDKTYRKIFRERLSEPLFLCRADLERVDRPPGPVSPDRTGLSRRLRHGRGQSLGRELLDVPEFNEAQELRKIVPFTLLRSKPIFNNTQWIDRTYAAHIHDHATRTPATAKRAEKALIRNEYLRYKAPIQRQFGSDRARA